MKLGFPRRRLLQSAALSLASAAVPVQAGASERKRRAPRYWVVVLASGGIDSVLTCDPKTRGEVHDWVDIPYAPEEIVEASGVPLGPTLATLAPWASRMAFLRGIQLGTANHQTGFLQFSRMKRRATFATPGFLEILGDQRDGQLLPVLNLGTLWGAELSSSWFGAGNFLNDRPADQNLLELLQKAPRDERAAIAQAVRRRAASLDQRGGRARGSGRAVETMRNLARLFERELPAFKPELSDPDPFQNALDFEFERALWAIQNDVARTIFVRLTAFSWDTHEENFRQVYRNQLLSKTLARFFLGLDTRSNRHGTLVQNTAVVVGSELGRYPRLNTGLGKDHFPEAPLMFYGAGFAPGVYGQTGRSMEGLPLSDRTGRPGGPGQVPNLDDVGATLVQLAGLSPETYGYSGRVLPFLLA
jgi:hypothetical protein